MGAHVIYLDIKLRRIVESTLIIFVKGSGRLGSIALNLLKIVVVDA